MVSGIFVAVIFTVIAVALGAAWVGGYLDKYQHAAQDKALDMMGDNRASYGLKGVFKGQKTGYEDLDNIQDGVADTVGGLVGKGGIGQDVGAGLSKGL